MKPLLLATILFLTATSTFAQTPAPRPAAKPLPPAPLFFKETWKESTENVPMTEDFVLNPELTLHMYRAGEQDFGVTNEGGVSHIWTGSCVSSCALTLSHKNNLVDLSSKNAKIRWTTKTSGFHEIRPVLKLADGTYLIGDHVDANTYDYHETELYLAEVRWLKLEMPKVLTKGTLMDKVDLSKVDEIGFADLTPGSGHGFGGFSDVGWIEVYGTPVARELTAK